MTRDDFVAAFGGVYENTAWAAARAFDGGAASLTDPESLADKMAAVVDDASEKEKEDLIFNHPELGAPAAALRGHSKSEQRNARLAAMDEEMRARFAELNSAYRKKFGFPLIIAVAGLNPEEILKIGGERLRRDAASERREAMAQIHLIARHRLRRHPFFVSDCVKESAAKK